MAHIAHFPLHLGLAYILLVSYMMRSLFISVRLPGAVGVMLSGFLFSFFMQEEILGSRDNLQGLAFFVVLLTAGFEISLPDLNLHLIVMASLPATFEILGIAAFSVLCQGSTWIEGTVLGATLFCVGDGLVIPKMLEYGSRFPNHPLPRLVFMWAPVEASYALTLFGILVGLSDPDEGKIPVNIWVLVTCNMFRILATLAVGALLGVASGYVITKRQRIDEALYTATKSLSRPLFTGQPVEAFLMILSVALGAFGIGLYHWEAMEAFGLDSAFQPELLVIVTGAFFASVAEPATLSSVEAALAGVWVFGQLVLFSMLGSRTETNHFLAFKSVFPIMLTGLIMRFLGIMLAAYLTLPIRPCQCDNCKRASRSVVIWESCFFFLCMLPRASIQGALGSVPSARRFFHLERNSVYMVQFISTAAKLYIVVLAVVGSVLLDLAAPSLLEHVARKREEFPCTAGVVQQEDDKAARGWTDKERKYADLQEAEAIQQLEAAYQMYESERAMDTKSRFDSEKPAMDNDIELQEAEVWHACRQAERRPTRDRSRKNTLDLSAEVLADETRLSEAARPNGIANLINGMSDSGQPLQLKRSDSFGSQTQLPPVTKATSMVSKTAVLLQRASSLHQFEGFRLLNEPEPRPEQACEEGRWLTGDAVV